MGLVAAISTAILIGLKVGEVIDWPWWVVTSPIWGLVVLVWLYILFLIIVAGLDGLKR